MASTGVVGASAITIRRNGRPLVPYVDVSAGRVVKAVRCADLNCANWDTVTWPATAPAHDDTDAIVDADGLPLILFPDQSTWTVKLAQCPDPDCNGAPVLRPISSGPGSYYPGDIVLSTDGLPTIAYQRFDSANTGYTVHCTSPGCATVSSPAVFDTGVIQSISMTVLGDGRPLLAYKKGDGLWVVRCADATCTAHGSPVQVEADVSAPSVTTGRDGLAILGYKSAGTLRVHHCENLDCTAGTSTVVDATPGAGHNPSITIGADGMAIVSHKPQSAGDPLKLTHCSNLACTAASSIVVDPGFSDMTAITIGVDGLPLVAYRAPMGQVKVLHASNPLGIPWFTRR